MVTVSKQYDIDYMNKICGECGKSSPKGLNLDLSEPVRERKWKCNLLKLKKKPKKATD